MNLAGRSWRVVVMAGQYAELRDLLPSCIGFHRANRLRKCDPCSVILHWIFAVPSSGRISKPIKASLKMDRLLHGKPEFSIPCVILLLECLRSEPQSTKTRSRTSRTSASETVCRGPTSSLLRKPIISFEKEAFPVHRWFSEWNPKPWLGIA